VTILSTNGKEAFNGGKGIYGWKGMFGGKESAWDTTGDYVKWVQSAALLEVVHSLVGTCIPLTTYESTLRTSS